MEDGRISYISELSTKGFAEGANEIQRHVRKMSDEVERSSSKMDAALDKIGTRVKQAFAVGSFVEFGKKIVEVRGEMESLQKTFGSLAGEQVGRKLYEDIKEFAVTTPMMAKDLAKGAQTLLGFNIAAEKVMPILRQIGDISMGDAQKFNSLTLAFAQMSSTGKLMGQDLLQMINAGFNPLVQISEKTGKSVAKLKDEMSKGAISVEMVEEAFRDATAEGGKFHNMLETQSKTMKGALSNLKGAYEDMLNEIGGKQQGLMLDTVNLAQTLIQNYEKVGQVVLGLVSTYGIYKAAVMAVTVAEGISTGSIILKTRALRAAAAAQALLNKTMLANPYVAAAAALGVLVGAVIASRDGLTDAERAQRDYNKTLEEAKNKQKEYNDETQNAINIARDDSAATEDREGAMRILINRYPDIIKKYIDEKGHLTDILNLKREIAAYDGLRANEDNRVNAELYRKYINVLNKAKSGKQLNDTEKILYEGAQKKYNDATPWYNRFTGNWTENATSYFKNLENQATYAYGRGKTQAKMNSFLEKLGEMETKDLQALQKTISTATKQVEGHKAKFIEEVGDYLERTDLDAIATKIDGIITARNKPKEETKDKKKPKTDHTAEQEATRRQKLFEQDMAAEESQSRQKRELRDALSELEIASEEDNAKRELMQMQKDHEDKLETIREQADQWKKEAYKAAEERWNATNKDKTKTFADTTEGKAGWQAQSLTPEQEQAIQARVDAENVIYNRGVVERLQNDDKANRAAIRNFLKEFGNYAEKKQAIYDDANEQICDLEKELSTATTDEAREAAEAKIKIVKESTKKQVEELDVQYGKAKAFMIDLFEDASKKSVGEINRIIDKYEALVKLLSGDSSISREILVTDFGFTDEEIDRVIKKLNAGEIKINDVTEAIKRLKGEAGEKSPWNKFISDLEEAIKKIKDKGNNDNIGTGIVEIGTAIQGIMPEVESFGVAIAGLFDTSDSDFRETVQRLKEVGGLIEGIGRMYSGDYIGGGMQAMSSIVSIATAFAEDKRQTEQDEYLRKQDKIRNAIEAAKDSIDRLADEMSKSYGLEALRLQEEQKRRAKENSDRALTGLQNTNINATDNIWGELWGFPQLVGLIGARYGEEFDLMWSKQEYSKSILDDLADDFSLTGESLMELMSTHEDGLFGVLGSWEELLNNNSPEKLARLFSKIRKEDEELWGMLTGHSDTMDEWLNALADSYDQLEEIETKALESITGASFDTVLNSFLDSLYNLADGAEDTFDDIGNNWQKMINKMVINNLIGEDVKSQLQEWYRAWAEAYSGDHQINEDELEALQEWYNKIYQGAADSVETMKKNGILKPISEAVDDAAEHFGDLRSKFLDTLMDMQFDAEEWKKELNKKLVQDLLEKQYFDVKMTVNGQEFDNFDAYAKDWNKRYLEALEAGDEAALQALIDELVQQRELLAEASEDLTSRLKETVEDTTFKDMSDSWVSTLMDMNATAEDWAQNIGQIMVQKIVEQLIAPSLLQPLLDGLQGAFNTAMSTDGATWDSVTGDAGVQEWLNKIKETFPEAQNIVRQIMESLGLITAEGLGNIKDNFVSALTDINKTAEDLGKDIANTMYSQMVDKFVDSKYGEELKNLSDEWAEALKSGDTAKIEELRQKIIALYETIGNDESIKQLLDDMNLLNAEAGSTPFDNLRSSYLSTLMDMSKETKDWTKEIRQMIAESFVDEFVMGEAFNEKLEQWKKQYKEITEDSNLSEEERMRQLKALSELIAADTESGKQQVNDILKWLGIREGQDQNATMNMAEAATYDQFELYLGMETSHLMVAEQTKGIAQQILTTLQGMNSITSPGTNYGEQIFMRLGTTNEYLLAVKRATEAIRSEFAAKLDIMNSHLSKL